MIVITGATRGIGRALALGFAGIGHIVHGCGRDPSEVAAMRESLGASHSMTRVDVADDSAVREWAVSVIANEPPELLINNAAIITREAPLWLSHPEEIDRIVDINVKGVVNVIRRFAPAMIERHKGVIVNMSSGWGRGADPGFGPYIATKWAVEGLTQALALELPSGMVAVALNPGMVDTEMLRSAFGDDAGRSPSADRWARIAIPFLLGITAADNGRPLTIELAG